MMTRSVRSRLAIGALCVALWGPALAEVSTDPLPRHRARTLLMDHTFVGITDGADPIPSLRWQAYRHLPAGRQLNKTGALRPDGRPDVVYRPLTAAPLVVWAYNNGNDEHDIAFAAWENDQWGPIRFLTSSANLNEIDPRLYYGPNGVIHVIWTVQPVDGSAGSLILLATRSPGIPGEDGTLDVAPAWSSPIRVSAPGEQVGHPTVAESHGYLWIAYERYVSGDAASQTQVVIRRRSLQETTSAFADAHVVTANRFGTVDPLLTSMHGRLWLDWHQGSDRLGFVRLSAADLGWAAIETVPLPNPSWQGVEDARQTVRRLAISGSAAAIAPATPN